MLKFHGHTFTDSGRCSCCVKDRKIVVDPTGTSTLRRKFRSDMARRWGALRVAVVDMIAKQDILGLKGSSALQVVAPGVTLSGTRQDMFAAWFGMMLTKGIYQTDGSWLATYLGQAFQMGTRFAQSQIGKPVVNKDSQHRFDGIMQLARSELTGITQAVLQQAIRVVALGIATNQKPMTVVRGIQAVIDRTGINRSNAMLQMMTIKAFGDATLDVYEAAGIAAVGMIPESQGKLTDAQTQSKAKVKAKDARRSGPGSRVSRKQTPSASTIKRIRRAELNVAKALGSNVNVRTAGDDDVCPICEGIAEDGPYTLNRARALIPAHPHCRCVFVPADDARFAQSDD